jgi:hypothetical protein
MNVLLSAPVLKTRSKPDKIVTGKRQIAYRVTDNAVMSDSLISDYTTFSNLESIVYTTRRANDRAKSNMCRHFKGTFSYSGGEGTVDTVLNTPSPDWRYAYGEHHRACCNAKAAVLARVITLDGLPFGSAFLSGQAQGLVNTAFDRLRPDLRTVSIPNFIADIADLKSLYVIWKKKLSIAKNLAGAHLNYKFGWKPTVGDLSDMIEGVTQLRAKLAAFKSQLGKIIQSSTTVHSSTNTVSGTYTHASFAGTATFSATVHRTCTATMAYTTFPLAVMGPMDEILRGLLDSLGFELNPRIIWDALPFTFVIDWFFGVGSWLDRYRIDALELPITLVDSFLQYKEDVKIEWSTKATHLPLGSWSSQPVSGGAIYTSSFFERMPIYPDYATFTGLGWKLPTPNQALLLVSLATVLKK